jgi:serine/threonine-protein phosphatase 5
LYNRAGEDDALVSDNIDLSAYVIDGNYSGPQMEVVESSGEYIVTEEFLLAMMETFKGQKRLHIRYALSIVIQFQKVVKNLPSLVDLSIGKAEKMTVCGDTHGQFYDLLNIFEINGLPSSANPYIFNGDFVDRGSFSVEVILTLMAWKVLTPCSMHLVRGNHEASSLNKIYGFDGEVKAKYCETIMNVFRCVIHVLHKAFGTPPVL